MPVKVIRLDEKENRVQVIFEDGERRLLDVKKYYEEQWSFDGSTFCFFDETFTLQVVKNKKCVNTGIRNGEWAELSARGDVVVCLTDVENGKGTLYRYDIESGSCTEIAKNVEEYKPVLSLNGSVIAYSVLEPGETKSCGYYCKREEIPQKVGEGKNIFAISDDANDIYYEKEDCLWVERKGGEAELITTGNGAMDLHFNESLSELLFSKDGTASYLVKDGKIRKQVHEEMIYNIILPVSTKEYATEGYVGDFFVAKQFWGIKSFAQNLFLFENEYCYLDAEFQMRHLTGAAYSKKDVAYAADAKSFVYIDYTAGKVKKVTDYESGGLVTDLFDGEYVKEIYAAGQLEDIYYIDGENELYCVSGKKEKRIDKNVRDVLLSEDGQMCYYIKEKKLWLKEKKIKLLVGRSREGEKRELLCGDIYFTLENKVKSREPRNRTKQSGKAAFCRRTYDLCGMQAVEIDCEEDL